MVGTRTTEGSIAQALAKLGDGADEVQGQKECSGPGKVFAFTAFTYASIAALDRGRRPP